MTSSAFRKLVYSYYRRHRRPMPWRDTRDPYKILVSEVMLQQTQVPRVMAKYPVFIAAFPTLQDLARAPLSSVLKTWQGLGYNRRALYLKKAAETVQNDFGGKLPSDRELVRRLPGMGPATSASFCAFAFGIPHAFIETNIRSVFIHHFFRGRQGVGDDRIMPLVEKTLDRRDPRNWYYALMDYGTHLKATHPNPGRSSSAYRRQSPLEGSLRQVRSRIVRHLLGRGPCGRKELSGCGPRHMLSKALEGLEKDGLIVRSRGRFSIP